MAEPEAILSDFAEKNSTTLASLKSVLGKLRTGRANLGMLDHVRVTVYGQSMPLNQCANLTVGDARLLLVKPYDRSLINDIEKGISVADLGINPMNDGETIRLPIPPLNEDRRKEMVKQGKMRGEEAKIGLRNHRRDANELLKGLERDKLLSQDDLKRYMDRVQEQTDRDAAKIEEILATKEKEILDI